MGDKTVGRGRNLETTRGIGVVGPLVESEEVEGVTF